MATISSNTSTPMKSATVTHNIQSFLDTARLINSDTKCHNSRSNFTSALTRRFYKNNSLRAHGNNLSKARHLHEQKRALMKSIQDENEALKILEIKLWEESFRRHEELERHEKKIHSCLLSSQSHVRRRRACEVVEKRRSQYKAECQIVMFCQTRMRGCRDRRVAAASRQQDELKRKAREFASVRIQSYQRTKAQIYVLAQLKVQRQLLEYQTSTKIQSLVRTANCKTEKILKLLLIRQKLLRTLASVCIQCSARKGQSKVVFRKYLEERLRKEEEEAKTELLAKPRSVSPVELKSPRRPFVVGKPHRQSTVRLIRVARQQNQFTGRGPITDTATPSQDVSCVFPGDTFDDADGDKDQRQRDTSSTYSSANIVEVARLKASARSARVARKRRKTKESEQASAREAVNRAIALELKRKQLLKVKSSRRSSVSPKSIDDGNRSRSEHKSRDSNREYHAVTPGVPQETAPKHIQRLQKRSSSLSSISRPREFHSDTLELPLESALVGSQQLHKRRPSLPSASRMEQILPTLFDISFEDFVDEEEDDLALH